MDIRTFTSNYQGAFGMRAGLPITFWYSDRLEAPTERINGCLLKCMEPVREGKKVSLNAETMGCGGGKFYTGFTETPEHVPNFVSLKEKYKRTLEMVTDFIREIQVPRTKKNYLHFARVDRVSSFDDVGGILFLATPDALSGLATQAYYDNNAPNAVSSPFDSGRCSVVTRTILKNQKQRKHTFLGFFDPPVRPCFEADILSFAIPMSRFRVTYHATRKSYLFDTYARGKAEERVQKNPQEEVSSNRPAVSFRILPDIQLHEVKIEDAAVIYHAIDTHRDYVRIWLPFVDTLESTTDGEEFLEGVLSTPDDHYEPIFGIWNEYNGICGLMGFHFSNSANHRTEIGYQLLPEYQHRGIMIQCVRCLCRWAIKAKEIKHIQVRCATSNVANDGIPLRLGFRLGGTEHAGRLLASREYANVHVYSILKEEIEASF